MQVLLTEGFGNSIVQMDIELHHSPVLPIPNKPKLAPEQDSF